MIFSLVRFFVELKRDSSLDDESNVGSTTDGRDIRNRSNRISDAENSELTKIERCLNEGDGVHR